MFDFSALLALIPMLTEQLAILAADGGAAGAAAAAGGAAAGGGSPFNGMFALGLAGLGAGLGVGLIGMAAAQAVGRNPTAFGNILTIGIIGMALAEAIAIYGLLMAIRG